MKFICASCKKEADDMVIFKPLGEAIGLIFLHKECKQEFIASLKLFGRAASLGLATHPNLCLDDMSKEQFKAILESIKKSNSDNYE